MLREGEPGEIYNVGTGDECTNRSVTRSILDVVGGDEAQINFVEDRPGHDQRYALNADKVRKLGWAPTWTFDDGLRATVTYYR